jgi:transcriptional regulator
MNQLDYLSQIRRTRALKPKEIIKALNPKVLNDEFLPKKILKMLKIMKTRKTMKLGETMKSPRAIKNVQLPPNKLIRNL